MSGNGYGSFDSLPDFSPLSATSCAVAVVARSVCRGSEAEGAWGCGMNSACVKMFWPARTGRADRNGTNFLVLKPHQRHLRSSQNEVRRSPHPKCQQRLCTSIRSRYNLPIVISRPSTREAPSCWCQGTRSSAFSDGSRRTSVATLRPRRDIAAMADDLRADLDQLLAGSSATMVPPPWAGPSVRLY
jgi:hypothetical protein